MKLIYKAAKNFYWKLFRVSKRMYLTIKYNSNAVRRRGKKDASKNLHTEV